jgi:hypothetical protein
MLFHRTVFIHSSFVAVWNVVGNTVTVCERLEGNGSGGEVNDRVCRLGGQRLPAVDFAHGDLSGGEQRPEEHGGRFR